MTAVLRIDPTTGRRVEVDLVSAVVLGTPSNPVTDSAAARPAGLPVVHWRTATQPTNWTPGDVWTKT